MSSPGSDSPKFSVIKGGGETSPAKEDLVERARRLVSDALRGRSETAYGDHLSPAPDLPEEPAPDERPAVAAHDTLQPKKVVSITEAPSYRARQIDGRGIAEGTSALDDSPMPVSADGEVDAQYHRIKEARLEVEAARETMPAPEPSQLEDLFLK